MTEDVRSYRGNSFLKRSGESIEWTEELIQEFIRCKEDVIYFCETYMKVVHVDRGLVPFILYPYQKHMINAFTRERYVCTTTCRQAGKTAAICGFALHYILFNEEKSIAILANKGATARMILSRIQKAYEHLPKWLQQGVTEWNKGSFMLENGSSIIAGTTTSDSIRGSSINCLLIDEAAYIDGWEEFYTSTFPTISSGNTTKVLLVSTPNGLNHYYSIVAHAERNENGFFPIRVTWEEVPGRNEAWRDITLKGMNNNVEKFNQEYSCEFIGSSGTLINGETLKSMVNEYALAETDGLSIYEQARENRSYVLCGDVSEGKGLDYSAFHVIDVTQMPYKQVCVYRNNTTPPAEYADIIYRVSNEYNDAMVLVENNNSMGNEVNSILHQLGHENLIYTENAGPKGKIISNNPSRAEIGVRTTFLTKSKGCSILKLLLEQNQFIVKDQNTIYELSRFSRKGKSYEAEAGATDDLVMGLVLFSWLTADNAFKELTNTDTVRSLRERTEEEIEEQFVDMGFVSDGADDWNDESSVVTVAAGEFDSFMWE